MEQNQRLKAAIIEVVNNQTESNDPPETNQTLARLITEGYSTQAAKELIGNVVVAEVFEVLSQGEPFDLKRYVEALNKLPEFPE
jgi:hypothetical protein